MITTRNGKFSVISYQHACGHPGERRCQSLHVSLFRIWAKEAELGLCRQCRADCSSA